MFKANSSHVEAKFLHIIDSRLDKTNETIQTSTQYSDKFYMFNRVCSLRPTKKQINEQVQDNQNSSGDKRTLDWRTPAQTRQIYEAVAKMPETKQYPTQNVMKQSTT